MERRKRKVLLGFESGMNVLEGVPRNSEAVE